MKSKWFTSLTCGVALVGVTLTGALPAPAADQAPDKNGPGVARISVLEGSAVVQRGDSHTQTNAVRNAPLLPGDYISTGETSRVELQFDGSTAVRLGGNVQARITNDDPNNRQVQLADGTVEIGMVRDGQRIAVETPSATVRATQIGDYRVTIAKDGSTWVTVRRGHIDVVTPQQTYALEEGRTLVVHGSAEHPTVTYADAAAFDSFDDFNAKRDQTMVAALDASPNLNPSIAGYDNLDAYGQWQNVPGYGQSWVPQQSSNWAPYRDGSWAWEGGYGWTWVGSEPWGWTPYHYGRWFYANGYGWAWSPPAYSNPVWSPALVGFFGFGVGVGVGAGVGVSVGVGFPYPYLGWVPLAPYQPYYPWYPGWAWTGYGWGFPAFGFGVGFGFPSVFATNVVNVTNINNINNINNVSHWHNFQHGGASGAQTGRFAHGTIAGHTVAVTSHNLGGRVGVIHGALPVSPTRASQHFGNGSVHAPVSFSKAFDSPRFATNRAGAARGSFEQQQQAVSHAIHGDVGHGNVAHGNVAHGNAPITRDNGNSGRANAPVSFHDNSAAIHGDTAMRHEAAPMTNRNADAFRNNDGARNNDAARGANAPSQSWQRFNQWRGNDMRANNGMGANNGMRTNNEMRGNNNEMRGSNNEMRGNNDAGSVSGRGFGQRDGNGASGRSSIPSYARESAFPSYARGSSNPSRVRSIVSTKAARYSGSR